MVDVNIALILIILFLLIFIAVKDFHYSNIVKQLTDKIMAKDYTEYKVFSGEEAKQPLPEEPVKKKVFDGVLGSTY